MNIFESYIIDNELIVPQDAWEYMKLNYTQEHIIKEISDAIPLYNIKLPYREISIDDVNADYYALKNIDNLFCIGEWVNKFDYKYPYINKYINFSNIGNKSSDYFHQIERWKCDATGYPSPQKTWDNERFRLTLFKALFSLKVKEINPTVLRNIISLRKYIAAQFRPSAAKMIYDYYRPEKVLDLSMGWGDRIAGAYASETVKRYVGIDPNGSLLKGYIEQIKHYRNIDASKKISYQLFYNRAENENLFIGEEFDMIFTSPPYYDKEKYDQSELQSYVRYKAFDSWMKDFLFKTIEIRTKNLKKGGLLIINISDIYTRKKHYKICDGMNDYIASTGLYEYEGAIGLRMPKRPMSKSSNSEGVFAEPMWIWRKK